MPLYEFRCPQGHDFEKFYRSIGGGRTEESCPECGASAARLMSAAGLVFKGTGFYITDYGKDGKKAERDAATAQSAKADTKAAETKPAESAAKASDAAAPAAPAPKPKTETRPAASPAPKASTKKTE